MKKIQLDHEILSITIMENLSNELLYEIFDYLDGYYIYEAFYNLNQRFQELITSSSLLFKIRYSSLTKHDDFIYYWQQIIPHHRSQILSFYLSISPDTNRFLSSFTINSSFDRLESLTFWSIKYNTLMPILSELSSLPRLYYLNIDIFDGVVHFIDIYRLVFSLSHLKYYKLTSNKNNSSVSLSIPTNEQNSLEYLLIDHNCTFQELAGIVYCTPQLRYLKSEHTFNGIENKPRIQSIRLENLICLSLSIFDVDFVEFKRFIKTMNCKLRKLSIIIHSVDITYLNASQWEELIREYFPQLNKFHLTHRNKINNNNHQNEIFSKDVNEFCSAFWIARKWALIVEINGTYINVIIQPFKKTCFNWLKEINIEFSKSLLLENFSVCAYNGALINMVKRLTLITIYHLVVYEEISSFHTLISLINLLPNLITIKFHSLPLNELTKINDNEWTCMNLSESRFKIRQLCIGQINHVNELDFIWKYIPNIVHFQVECIINMNIKFFVKTILKKRNNIKTSDVVHSLCFRILFEDDQMIKTIDQMINDEKLLDNYNYILKRKSDYIF